MALPVEINPLQLKTSGSYSVSKSLRFRSSASAYLNRTFGTPTSATTWTISFWAKLGSILSSTAPFIGIYNASSNNFQIRYSSGNIEIYAPSTGTTLDLLLTQVFRDPSAWYHFVLTFDTTQATASNRVKFYVNGSQVTAFTTATYPALNATVPWNTNGTVCLIGAQNNPINGYFDGYLAEVNFIDGLALTASSFGTYDTNGVWQPIKYSGSYGTNGFYLNFGNTTSTTTLGYDTSGNSNNWTTNNISLTAGSTYDSMLDSPTTAIGTSYGIGNYCVLNPVAPNPSTTASTITDGNLTASASAANTMRKGTFGINSGTWYFEATLGSTIQGLGLGEANINSFGTNSATVGARTYYLYNTSTIYSILPGADTGITSGIASGGTLAVAVDYTNSKLWLGYAASGAGSITWVGGGNPSTGTTPTYTFPAGTQTLYPLALTNGPSLFVNFGQRPFTYTPPTGFNALNTYNLPTPTIANGAQYMAASTWTGNGTSQTINNGTNNTIGATFQPDFIWIKDRSTASSHALTNSIVGTSLYLISNTTGAELTDTTSVTAINSTGFVLGAGTAIFYTNKNGDSFIGWQWKANGTGVTNTNGSITSTVSANTTAGFSILTFNSGTAGNKTVGHGLGVTPAMIITKDRTSSNSWTTWHQSLPSATQSYLWLNSTNASANDSRQWANTAPTSSVFSFESGYTFTASDNCVAYCWSAVSGYSAFGSYTGNGSADGPFVYANMRPRYVLIKRTDSTGDWYIWDTSRNTYNVVGEELLADTSGAGNTATDLDILSNGFKIRTTTAAINASGGTYIYAAFAENPFNSSRAR